MTLRRHDWGNSLKDELGLIGHIEKRKRGKDDGGNGSQDHSPRPVPPENPTPPRLMRRRVPLSEIEPYTDPGIQELIDLPIPAPLLQKEIRKQQAQNPIEKEIELLKLYREKPLLFFRDELGLPIDIWRNDKPPADWQSGDPVPLWTKQREIIEALVKHRKVAVKTGHGVGKTFIAGGLALYLSFVWHATGLTTAPTFRQVRRALWGEIHYLYNRAKNPLGGKLNQVSLDLGDKWFVEGFATDKPSDNITGVHEENIFVIVDEAGGVLPETFEALDAILTSENSFVLYIGNPVCNDGPFFEAFKPGSGFHQITISCYDSPNLKHNRIIYSKLTAKKWVDDKVKKWGKDSALFKVRVEGEFAEETQDTLIPLRYIETALRKGAEGELLPDKIAGFGLDVARQGSDRSVFGIRWDSGLFRIIETTTKKRETDTAGRMKSIYDESVKGFKYRGLNALKKMAGKDKESTEKDEEKEESFPPINVDDIGVGGGVVDILIEDEYPVNGVNVSEQPDPSDPEEAKLFLNKRAQYYWKLKKLFENELVAIEDEDLAFELNKIRMEFMRSGKIKIVDKETLKKEMKGKSPDLAECMMLAFAVDSSDVERDLVRFL